MDQTLAIQTLAKLKLHAQIRTNLLKKGHSFETQEKGLKGGQSVLLLD